ncbi:dynamin family protein [Marinospirillum minutulum]|uniref:dynamin family protein n=1 Tax=Marinospirillum minutulum TaxID=64974 RepID=UPI00040BB97A|nr:dynamin family protein [Marinospirillum minutulum]
MHQLNIDTLRMEAKRQLAQLKSLLEKAQQKGLVDEPAADDHNRATFDTQSIAKVLEVLDGESYKLDHLDMVLAVVGTMKAGKSTSINAIVGAEVLPNRNRPMTTLPTLIRHTPGVLQPRLIFEKIQPLNELLVALSQAIKSANPEALTELQNDKDMKELLIQIRQQNFFESQHEGAENIFRFLKSLNDLVRLCFTLKATFPFDAYATVEAMPVIEVEFSHLKDTPVTQGRLTLLDTPGPNEAGQQHLRHMLKDQLKKASAVLAVLDYTQLKSDADEQVRENLMEISYTAKDRMYALVNKFDQKDRNGDDEPAVKKYVAQTLMKNVMAESSVFPVSSKQGYLASRARNELERNGKLPNNECWVEDFGKERFGGMWVDFINDPQMVKAGADKLWQESGFSIPLEQVIFEAHRNAAMEALRSAASKLDNFAKDTGNFFKANVGSLKKSVAELQKNIDRLQQDIENIAKIEASTEDALKGILKGTQRKIETAAAEVQKEVTEKIESYFKEGKTAESDNLQKKDQTKGSSNSKEKTTPINGFFGVAFASILGNKREEKDPTLDFDPSSPIIKLDDRAEAQDFIKRIESSIKTLMDKAESDCNSCIQSGIDNFSSEFEGHRIDALEKIKESIKRNLDDFDIMVNLPNTENIKIDSPVSSLMKNAIMEKTRTVTKHRRQDGLWGTICRVFDTDHWGWESYQDSENYFEIDIIQIDKSTRLAIDAVFESANDILNKDIYPQLQNGVEDFFCAFRKRVENIRGDLIAGVQKHSLDHARKADILAVSSEMAIEAAALEKDCITLNDSAETLRYKESPSSTRIEVQV